MLAVTTLIVLGRVNHNQAPRSTQTVPSLRL